MKISIEASTKEYHILCELDGEKYGRKMEATRYGASEVPFDGCKKLNDLENDFGFEIWSAADSACDAAYDLMRSLQDLRGDEDFDDEDEEDSE